MRVSSSPPVVTLPAGPGLLPPNPPNPSNPPTQTRFDLDLQQYGPAGAVIVGGARAAGDVVGSAVDAAVDAGRRGLASAADGLASAGEAGRQAIESTGSVAYAAGRRAAAAYDEVAKLGSAAVRHAERGGAWLSDMAAGAAHGIARVADDIAGATLLAVAA